MTFISRMLGPKGTLWTMTQTPLIKYGMTAAEAKQHYRPKWGKVVKMQQVNHQNGRKQ